ncbi:hybrid sensor histidine kinase/response regulator [Melittangium boletus]|uniref:histidine kinase n=1 Tax=Melittangium boletus DSM 14713 TaxID=1294270 RepID=A0A250IHE4_9BACT|nr:response regulator [Melittangium boletus]ATB30698.1 hybrid sensor histidine kinase/response regulator [Melittangium boletus DSM 14713]
MSTPASAVSDQETPRLLLVAGEPEGERVLDVLKRAGVRVHAERVSTPEEFQAALGRPWELAVCAPGVPGLGFREVAPPWRAHHPLEPFVVVAAQWDETEMAAAMEAEAGSFLDMDRLALLGAVVRRELKRATERHQHQLAERQQAHSRWLLERIVDSLPFVLFVKDAEERRLCVANKTFADAFGVTKEWLLGKLDHDYFPQEQADSFVAIDTEILETGKLKTFEELARTGGVDRVYATRKLPLLDDSGRARYVLGITEDITERKAAEETLRRSKAELEAANQRLADNLEELKKSRAVSARTLASYQQRALQMELIRQQNEDLDRLATELASAKRNEEERAREAEAAFRLRSEFLANFSHEIRTPLNGIIGYCDLLMREEGSRLTAHGRRDLNVVKKNAQTLLALINDILDLSKIEAGRLEVVVERVDMAELAEDCTATVKEYLKGKDVELRADIDERVAHVRTDALKLRQILLNLLSNAAKFTESGEVSLTARAEGNEAVFIVEDTGIGIPPDQLPFIFEKFRQVDGSTTRKVGGTGLGLAIVRELSKVLGGGVEVQSTLGRGTTFTVRLAGVLEGDTLGASRELDKPVAPEDVGAALAPLARGGTVLVVDDDVLVQQLIAGQLEPSGFIVVTASDGLDALRKARELRPQAIVLDIHLPRMDGWSVLSTLKSEPDLARIPVIIISVEEQRARGFSLGACEYLIKPVEPNHLVDVVRRSIGTAAGAGEVLVVDDDASTRELVSRSLRRAGFSTHEAHNGEDALLKARVSPPTLVVLDLMMPNLDGFEVIRRMRADKIQTPVVVLTGKSLSAEEEAVLRDGFAGFVQKGGHALEEVIGQAKGLLIQQNAQRTSRLPRILYVEDNPQNRDIVRRYLGGLFEVLEADDGELGVERATKEAPDLILMDLSLPRVDGWEATRRLRQVPAVANTPVIAVTAHAGREYQEKASAAGCDAYLTKPLDRELLLETIRKHLGKTHG